MQIQSFKFFFFLGGGGTERERERLLLTKKSSYHKNKIPTFHKSLMCLQIFREE
jgi:hypothetical protein